VVPRSSFREFVKIFLCKDIFIGVVLQRDDAFPIFRFAIFRVVVLDMIVIGIIKVKCFCGLGVKISINVEGIKMISFVKRDDFFFINFFFCDRFFCFFFKLVNTGYLCISKCVDNDP